MQRRLFLKRAILAAGLGEPRTSRRRFKLGAISDSFSQDFEEALKIMNSSGLAWVEIRHVFNAYITEASSTQVGRIKDLLRQYGFRVSVIDSALYKCTLPGTKPIVREKDTYPYTEQMDLLKRACQLAHTLQAEKIRGFTFWRVADSQVIWPRISEQLQKAAEIAKSEGMRLVIENEETCNAATGHELAHILQVTPASNLGANWDIGNGYWQGEVSFPDGYRALDKSRIWHMHLKGVKCGAQLTNCQESLAGQSQIDLAGQFRQLVRDGYQETMSLECEFQVPGLSQRETSKRSLAGLLRVLDEVLEA